MSSQRSPRAARMSPTARRQHLLDAAVVAFAARGLARTGHADVAREAGTSVPTVFHYFKTRHDLQTSVLGAVETFFLALAREHHASEHAPLDALAAHAQAFVDSVHEQPHYARLWLEWSTALRDDVWPAYLEYTERLIEIIAATVQAGQADGSLRADMSANEGARLLTGLAHMAALMSLAPASDLDMTRHIALAVSTLKAPGS